MNYILPINFDNNDYILSRFNRIDLTALDVSMQLTLNSEIQHSTWHCMSKLFSVKEYNLYLQGFFEFEDNNGKLYSLVEILKHCNIEEIYNIFLNFNNTTNYQLTSSAKFFIKSNDMTKIITLDTIKPKPLDTMSKYLEDILIFKNTLVF